MTWSPGWPPAAATSPIWPAGRKLAGATCRIAGLLHLAGHLRDGWNQPIGADTFAGAARLAGYLVDHARAVFDLMGADPRVDDAAGCWTGSPAPIRPSSRRDAHAAAPAVASPRPPASTIGLLQEHGWLRRVDADPVGPRAAGPLAAVPGQPSATRHRTYTTYKTSPAGQFCGSVRGAWRHPGKPDEGPGDCHVIQRERPQALSGPLHTRSPPPTPP